jgi:hypothetical protein
MPQLNLAATNPQQLLAKLATVDITVPLQGEGRTAQHREQYIAARLLAALAATETLKFPLALCHREQPDFALTLAGRTIGIECVEATHQEWAHVIAKREIDYPEALIAMPWFQPGQRTFSPEEREKIARGEGRGSVWVGSMAKQHWAEGVLHTLAEKTAKLRNGNYGVFTENWLAVQDEWPAPLYRLDEKLAAAELCAELIKPLLALPAFTHIFVGRNEWYLRLHPLPVRLLHVPPLWPDALCRPD